MDEKQFNVLVSLLERIAIALEERSNLKVLPPENHAKSIAKTPNLDAIKFIDMLEQHREDLRGKRLDSDAVFLAIGYKNATAFDKISLSKAIPFTSWAKRQRTNKGAVYLFS